MRLAQVEYFLAAAEQLNFTAAAKTLYISQPALSRQIAALEEELGVTLFYRTSRKVILTPAGRQLQSDLQKLLLQLEQIKARAAEEGSINPENLRIGCFDGMFTDDFLHDVLEKLKKSFPCSQILLTRNSFKDLLDALSQEKLDMILTLDFEAVSTADYCIYPLVKRTSALIYSDRFIPATEEILSINDFSGRPFLTAKQNDAPGIYRNNLQTLKKLGITASEIIEMENLQTLETWLTLGWGFTLLSDHAIQGKPNLNAICLAEDVSPYVVVIWKWTHPLAGRLEKSLKHN